MNRKTTAATLMAAKQAGKKTVWLTSYDTSSARMAEAAGVDVLLVGDSLGMVCLGFDSTIPVTLEQMIHHTSAVVRGRSWAWVVCDLPFGTYQKSPEQAFLTSAHVLKETGCHAVKLEGGESMASTIRFLSERGIAVVAHIGLQPQSIHKLGNYRQRGNTEAAHTQLIRDAQAVEAAGATAVVLECIPDTLAGEITATCKIPTVGIGAGKACDAQVLVWHDLLGLSENPPPFAPAYAQIGDAIHQAIQHWASDVRT